MEHLTSAATLIMVNLPYSNFKFNEEALKGGSSYRLDDEKIARMNRFRLRSRLILRIVVLYGMFVVDFLDARTTLREKIRHWDNPENFKFIDVPIFRLFTRLIYLNKYRKEERNRVFPTKSNAMVVDKSRDFDGKANKIFTEHSFAA
ncbi:hypothetical protein APICC_05225 [Apis cerana cerana]|uniref:Uncharacterized protein n=1 Tax=Apis cerana cerana TaxID=94128 RepID=A0A2A3EMS6_APICC|nr:hypothetical protein APICC_05225 [Apis cerana cerana]